MMSTNEGPEQEKTKYNNELCTLLHYHLFNIFMLCFVTYTSLHELLLPFYLYGMYV